MPEQSPALATIMTESRIPVSRFTRELVRRQKRGGETYDELLRKMVQQYDPTETKD